MSESQIESAALVVSHAKAHAETAQAAVTAAREVRDNLAARLRDLEARRNALVAAARATDTDQAGIALKLAVLDADSTDLKPLVAEAESALRQAEAVLISARQDVVTKEQELQIAADIDLQAKLETWATDLAARLQQAVDELRQVWARRNARPTWGPEDRLVFELERLRLTAQGLRGAQK